LVFTVIIIIIIITIIIIIIIIIIIRGGSVAYGMQAFEPSCTFSGKI